MPRKHNRWREIPGRPHDEFWRVVAADDGVAVGEPPPRTRDKIAPHPEGGWVRDGVEDHPYTNQERDRWVRSRTPDDLWVKYRDADGKSHTVHTKLRDIEVLNPNTLHRSHYGCSAGFPEEHVYCVIRGGPMYSEFHYPITHWKVAKAS